MLVVIDIMPLDKISITTCFILGWLLTLSINGMYMGACERHSCALQSISHLGNNMLCNVQCNTIIVPHITAMALCS